MYPRLLFSLHALSSLIPLNAFTAFSKCCLDTTFLRSSVGDDSFCDPYDDLLNFEKPIVADLSPTISSENSIVLADDARGQNKKKKPELSSVAAGRLKIRKKFGTGWEYWDEFMQQEFGDMDGELKENELWMGEIRDIVEQKRGIAIWSKKTDEEIQKEIKKSMASKGMVIPPAVGLTITSVFLERALTMREFKKLQEMAFVEYRKWMAEQREKTKKDPLLPAKIEVSKTWLTLDPSTTSRYSYFRMGSRGRTLTNMIESIAAEQKKTQGKMVVLDEVTGIFVKNSVSPAPGARSPSPSPLPSSSLSVGGVGGAATADSRTAGLATTTENNGVGKNGGTSNPRATRSIEPIFSRKKVRGMSLVLPPSGQPLSTTTIGGAGGAAAAAGSYSHSPLNTYSVMNWEASHFEYLQDLASSEARAASSSSFSSILPGSAMGVSNAAGKVGLPSDASKAAILAAVENRFKIDGQAMFVQNNCPEEFFVAL